MAWKTSEGPGAILSWVTVAMAWFVGWVWDGLKAVGGQMATAQWTDPQWLAAWLVVLLTVIRIIADLPRMLKSLRKLIR